jgi:hypothetical protein
MAAARWRFHGHRLATDWCRAAVHRLVSVTIRGSSFGSPVPAPIRDPIGARRCGLPAADSAAATDYVASWARRRSGLDVTSMEQFWSLTWVNTAKGR